MAVITRFFYILSYVVDTIWNPLSNQVINFAKSMLTHLTHLALTDCADGSKDLEIDLLNGADFTHLFHLDHVVSREQGVGSVATLTRIGYVLSGPVPLVNQISSHITVAHV